MDIRKIDYIGNICEAQNWGDFVELKVDSFALSLDERDYISTEMLGHPLEYDEQWFICSIIIPIVNSVPDINSMWLLVDEFVGVNQASVTMINDIITEKTKWERMIRIGLPTEAKVSLLSMMYSSADMRA